jgi:Ni,Fe-hydrogenase III large subunit
MSAVIPMGPFHPALEEPYKIEVTCEGERITGADITVGFNFRGVEWLAERKTWTQDIVLLERICGICSNVHTMTFCRAIEQLGQLEVPERAQFIRVVVAETERLHSHLLWAGVACHQIGFETLFMTCFALREQVMDLLEAISGNRVNYAMNRPGGVTRDLTDPRAVLAAVRDIRTATSRQVIPVLTTDRTVRARCARASASSPASRPSRGARSARWPGPPGWPRTSGPHNRTRPTTGWTSRCRCSRAGTSARGSSSGRWRSWPAATSSSRRSGRCPRGRSRAIRSWATSTRGRPACASRRRGES